MNRDLKTLIDSIVIDELYVLIPWPDVQGLMEYRWFRAECFRHHPPPDRAGESAYFVPISRIMEIKQPG